jgi:hypothetical protein
VKSTFLVHLMVMSTVDEDIRDTKTNKPDDEIENTTDKGTFVSRVTMTSFVSIMRQ